MAKVEDEKIQYKIRINTDNHLVSLYVKINAKIQLKNTEIMYEDFIEERIGFVESIETNQVKEQINRIVEELYKKMERFEKGLEELEKLDLEIEAY